MRFLRHLASGLAITCTATCAAAPGRRGPLASVTPAGEETEEESEPAAPAPVAAGLRPLEHAAPHEEKPPCAEDLAHCPEIGCETPGSPHALFNQRKRRTTDGDGNAIAWASAVVATVPLLRDLQIATDKLVGEGKDLTAEQRDQIRLISVDHRQLGEGTAVRIVGYIAPPGASEASSAHRGGHESVNCRLIKPDSFLDIHIPLVEDPATPECGGVVVEMIPQGRESHPNWTWQKLRKLATDGRKVMAVGPLFYDNEHLVNADCTHLRKGQPKRLSLWEVHPIAEFYVCDDDSCTARSKSGWKRWD